MQAQEEELESLEKELKELGLRSQAAREKRESLARDWDARREEVAALVRESV